MTFIDTALGRFLALSIALHSLVMFVVSVQPRARDAAPEPIAVSLLPPSERPSVPTGRAAKGVPAARTPNVPTIVAKKDPAVAKESKEIPAPQRERAEPIEQPREPPAKRELIPENTVVVERTLPTLKELLPSVTYSSPNARAGEAVNLNTRDPVYVSYFTKIKQSIEQNWEYPEVALRYGLQGRLSLEFTIGVGGQLEQLRMIRSSGSQVLDEEALRAIKAAAPFPPIPSWIKTVPLLISASMEYHDNRLHQFAR